MLLLLLLFVSAIACIACGDDNIVLIENASGLLDFAYQVNNKHNGYNNMTVYLANDIDMSNTSFSPIGVSNGLSDYTLPMFNGTFDGRGHVIRNLNVTSSERTVGLFGYSRRGSTIKNLVLDSSNSFHSNYPEPSWFYVSAFLGNCRAYNNPCTIENSVNMASISFAGSGFNQAFIGPFHGACDAESEACYTKNVVNYGNVTVQGSTTIYIALGGISGFCKNIEGIGCVYSNCMNYGTVTYISTNYTQLGSLYVGGVVGYSYNFNEIENCLNAGEIIHENVNTSKVYPGGISGNLANSNITHCFWTNNTNLNGHGITTGISSMDNSSSPIPSLDTINTSIWLLNSNGSNVTFMIDDEVYITCTYAVIVVPVVLDSNFSGWYLDEGLTNPLNSSHEIKNITTFYGSLIPVESVSSSSSSSSPLISSSSSSSSPSLSISSSEFTSNTVEIAFESKSLTQSEIETFIKSVVSNGSYEITGFTRDSDEVKVIIKFGDVSSAMNFVETVKSASNSNFLVKRIRYIYEKQDSFSFTLLPLEPLLFIFAILLILP